MISEGSKGFEESPAEGSSNGETFETGYMGNLKQHLYSISWEVRQEESSFAATPTASNADFDPIPPSKRTWNWGAYVAYWMADAWAVSNWEVASSMIAVGLDWKMAIGACVLGNTIMGLVITSNGRIGAILHTPFPVLARMPFGYYFSYFVVLSRCVLAIVWLGVQTTTGGQCMAVLLTAIWPSFANIPNHISEDEGITTSGMVAFLLYFLLQLPFLCIPYTKVLSMQPTTPPIASAEPSPVHSPGGLLLILPRFNTSLPSSQSSHRLSSWLSSEIRCTRLVVPSARVRSSLKDLL